MRISSVILALTLVTGLGLHAAEVSDEALKVEKVREGVARLVGKAKEAMGTCSMKKDEAGKMKLFCAKHEGPRTQEEKVKECIESVNADGTKVTECVGEMVSPQ